MDLRVQKTNMALTKAFSKLLEKKRFEDITVNEICNNAMVRRATFYTHFLDKYDLFAFVIRENQREFREKNQAEKSTKSPYVSVVKNVLDFLDENEALVRSVMKSDMFSILLDIISEQLVADVKILFQADEQKGKTLIADADMMAQAFSGALISLARWWIANKKVISKEKMVEEITYMINKLIS